MADHAQPSLELDNSAAWAPFSKHTAVFDVLPNGQSLYADVHLPPPSAGSSKSHPLIITYHGGGLIGGHRGGYEYITTWIPAYATQANAIIVSPDHRLLPRASARELRQDLDALWKWVQSSLNTFLDDVAPGHTADLSRILVEGGSGGGYCAAHLTLSYPDKISAAIWVYPMLDGFHEQGLVQQKMAPPEMIPNKEDLAVWIKQQRSQEKWTIDRPEDMNYLIALFKDTDAYLEAFGSDKDLSPAYRIAEGGDATGVPERLWILHGRNDSMVPSHYSEKFFETLKTRGWSSNVRLTIVSDEMSEHGFDQTWTLKDDKLSKNLSWINEAWLK